MYFIASVGILLNEYFILKAWINENNFYGSWAGLFGSLQPLSSVFSSRESLVGEIFQMFNCFSKSAWKKLLIKYSNN